MAWLGVIDCGVFDLLGLNAGVWVVDTLTSFLVTPTPLRFPSGVVYACPQLFQIFQLVSGFTFGLTLSQNTPLTMCCSLAAPFEELALT